LAQDRRLEFTQVLAGIQAEFVSQLRRVRREDVEGFRTASGAVQRHHLQPAAALTVGIRGAQVCNLVQRIGEAP